MRIHHERNITTLGFEPRTSRAPRENHTTTPHNTHHAHHVPASPRGPFFWRSKAHAASTKVTLEGGIVRLTKRLNSRTTSSPTLRLDARACTFMWSWKVPMNLFRLSVFSAGISWAFRYPRKTSRQFGPFVTAAKLLFARTVGRAGG